jgi:hypothetical protein
LLKLISGSFFFPFSALTIGDLLPPTLPIRQLAVTPSLGFEWGAYQSVEMTIHFVVASPAFGDLGFVVVLFWAQRIEA